MSENGVYIKDRTRFPPVLLKPEKRTELFRSNILLGIIHSVMLTIRTHNQTVNCCSLEVCSYEQFHVMFWALLFAQWCRVHHRRFSISFSGFGLLLSLFSYLFIYIHKWTRLFTAFTCWCSGSKLAVY